MEVATRLKPSGVDEVLMDFYDKEMTDTVCAELHATSSNVEEDAERKPANLPSTKRQLDAFALIEKIGDKAGLLNESFLSKKRYVLRLVREEARKEFQQSTAGTFFK